MLNNYPAGLVDHNQEVWTDSVDVYILTEGKKIQLKDAPPSLVKLFKMELEKDSKVLDKLETMGCYTKAQKLIQFLKCRYGNFDNEPDFTEGKESNVEYINCPKRGNCTGEGVVCLHMKVKYGYLTNREIDVLKFMTLDLPDKQLSDMLHISQNTLRNHKSNIMHKTGISSQVGLAMFALKHVLV